jgi:hypothetical protein
MNDEMIRVQARFGLEDLLNFLRQDGRGQDLDGYHTTREWMQILGLTWEQRMREIIAAGIKAGCVAKKRVKRRAIDDSERWTTVYKFMIQEKKEEPHGAT